ncbi:MAG: hypothetical protein AB1746_05770 [Candidatus Zixiibacteriota bacterium]
MYRLPKFRDVKNNLHYNYLDIISVPAAALKAKKIFIGSASLLAALIIYDIFTYAGFAVAGISADLLYEVFGLLPLQLSGPETVPGKFIYYAGIAIGTFIILSGMTAIGIIDIEKFRGNQFCTALQALRFARSRMKQLFMSILTIVLFIGFIVFLGVLVGLLARIPYLGELIYSVFFFFPNFIISLVTVLVIFVLFTGIFVMPSAVAADRAGETFNSILGTFSTAIRQPLRWAGYSIYILAAAKVAGFVFAYVCFRAVQFMKIITTLGGGEKIEILISSGLSELPIGGGLAGFTFNIFPGVNFGFDILRLMTAEPESGLFAVLMAISLFLVFLIIWGYIVSIISTGQTYAYVIIRKIREGYFITDEEPMIK